MIVVPIWPALPPEVASTLLSAGPGPGSLLAGAAAWAELAGQYEAAAGELNGILAAVAGNALIGPTGLQFVSAHLPGIAWLTAAAAKSTQAMLAHTAAAGEYTAALAAMPTMAELMTNHAVHAVLVATNFFGVNTIPIALNEADYVRMWDQAASVMLGYDATTTTQLDTIVPTPPSPVFLIPGVGEAGSAAADADQSTVQAAIGAAGGGAIAAAAAGFSSQLPGAAAAQGFGVANDGTPHPVGTGNLDSGSAQLDDAADGAAQLDDASDGLTTQGTQLFSQLPSIASTAAQPIGELAGQPEQLLTQGPQLLTQAPQLLSQMLSGAGAGDQLLGTTPLGFTGTTAIPGANPAGLTNVAGGAFSTGAGRPLLPGTWASATPLSAAGRAPLTAAAALSPAPGASSGGAGGSGMMTGMAGGRQQERRRRAYPALAYIDDDDDDGEEENRTDHT